MLLFFQYFPYLHPRHVIGGLERPGQSGNINCVRYAYQEVNFGTGGNAFFCLLGLILRRINCIIYIRQDEWVNTINCSQIFSRAEVISPNE